MAADESTEQSIRSSYAVIYSLKDGNWAVQGDGRWCEVHLCKDSSDNSYRLLAWTADNPDVQDVLMNANISATCEYKQKADNFHSFKDEEGERFGLAFHKSDDSKKQAEELFDAVNEAIKDQPSVDQPSATERAPASPFADMGGREDAKEDQGASKGGSQPRESNAVQNNQVKQISEFFHEKDTTGDVDVTKARVGLGALQILPPKPAKNTNADQNITGPSDAKRIIHGKFDPTTGKYSGLPAEWEAQLNKSFHIRIKDCRGTKLDAYDSKIPDVLELMKSYLKDNGGYQQVGIFRKAPDKGENDRVKEVLDAGKFETFAQSNKIDVNVMSNLIKVWFRDLPKPILSVVPRETISGAQNASTVPPVIEGFPEPNKSVLLWLLDLCAEVSKLSDENKMSTQNLAIVVGPNMFTMTDEDMTDPLAAMQFSGKVVTFMRRAIEWRVSLL